MLVRETQKIHEKRAISWILNESIIYAYIHHEWNNQYSIITTIAKPIIDVDIIPCEDNLKG